MNWKRLIDDGAKYSARLGGITVLVSAFLVSTEVIFRNFGVGFRLHSFELTNYAFAGAVSFAFAFAVAQRAHIRIDVIYQLLPVSLRAILDVLALFLVTIVASGMAYYAWKVVSHSYRLGARPNSTLDIPLSLPQSIWAIGLTWFALVAFVMALRAVVHLMRGDFALVNDEMGIPSGDPHETLR